MAMMVTRSRSIASSSSTAEKLRPVSVTTQPPDDSVEIAVTMPMLCMSGAHGTNTGPGFVSWVRTSATPPSSGYRTAAVRLSTTNRSS